MSNDTGRSTILSGDKVTKQFGGLVAVNEVDFSIPQDSIFGLIGPNGAGKTTLFNCITGNQTPTSGRVHFRGADVTLLPPHEITRRGIARTFQSIRLFKEMPVIDNVLVGMHLHMGHGLWDVFLKTPRFTRNERKSTQRAEELLTVVGLSGRRDDLARSLPYGAQRRLEIARALATEPKMLLLDEPTAGMNLNETDDLMRFIRDISKQFDLTILLIEHDMKFVMGLCERVMVLNNGLKVAEGTPEEIQGNPEVIQAYLGKRRVAHAQT